MSKVQATISWLLLIILTVVSVYLSKVMETSTLFIVLIFAIVFVKGQQITDIFMELKHAPTKWRMLLLGYVLILPLIIGFIYII